MRKRGHFPPVFHRKMELILWLSRDRKRRYQKESQHTGAGFLPALMKHMYMSKLLKFRFQRHPIQNEHLMFITTNLEKRRPIFSDPACARIAAETLYSIQDFYPFFLYGFVIMPDHVHVLLRIPEGESISKTIGLYKRAVTFNIGKGPLWQSRFHIRMPDDPAGTLHYIHMNPVKAGLCTSPEEYSWSSASGRWEVEDLLLF